MSLCLEKTTWSFNQRIFLVRKLITVQSFAPCNSSAYCLLFFTLHVCDCLRIALVIVVVLVIKKVADQFKKSHFVEKTKSFIKDTDLDVFGLLQICLSYSLTDRSRAVANIRLFFLFTSLFYVVEIDCFFSLIRFQSHFTFGKQ